MKKLNIILVVIMCIISACSNDTDNKENNKAQYNQDLSLNINVSKPYSVEDNSRAYLKSGWTENDIIKIWFNDQTTTNPNLVIKYDGTNWYKDNSATIAAYQIPSSGTMKALYNDKLVVTSNDSYTYSDNILTANISNWKYLTEIQITLRGLAPANYANYTLACDKLTPYSSYTVGTSNISATGGILGGAAEGIQNTDGVTFTFATSNSYGSATDYTFTLKHNTFNIPLTYKATNKTLTSNSSKQIGIIISDGKFQPSNILNGDFSVSSTKKVKFTKANVYWNGSDYNFEKDQLSYPYNWRTDHVGHFYWTKTAAASYAETYNDPPVTVTDKFFADGSDASHKLTVEGNTNLYTLAENEWNYLLKSRTNASNLCGIASVQSVSNCLIIAPDDFSGTIRTSYPRIDELNAAGLVCLVPAGCRKGQAFNLMDHSFGFYHTATPQSATDFQKRQLLIYAAGILFESEDRATAVSLRLVQ